MKIQLHVKMGYNGEGNGNPLQYSCLENPMDRGTWWATVYGVSKRWQEYMEELYKKAFYDPDNHDPAVTHLEPETLECEYKWALGSITMNKASGDDGIPAELFKF